MKSDRNQRSKLGRRLPSILDRELGDNSRDAFGHRHFAKALEHLIENDDWMPPFSIGLLGAWGTGKSTIKELYLEALKSSKSNKRNATRGARIFLITFNAWRHGGEQDLKRALLRAVYLRLGGNEDKLDEELFNQINVTASERRPLLDWFSETFAQMFFSGLALVVLLAAIFGIVLAVFSSLSQLSEWSTLGVAGFAFSFAAYLIHHLVKLRLQTPALFQPRTSISFPSRTAEEYEKLLFRQIAEFLRGTHKSVERIVIFVDDLDRLSAAEMVRGLDAIRSFLELPLGELEKPIGVVFVISCDENRVAEALHSKLYLYGSEGLPGTVFSKTDARRYLDRLFQFRLEIPPFPKQDMRIFARNKLEALDGGVEALEAKGLPIDAVIDTLVHVGVQSPRNAIQLLNAFLHSWWMAVERETAGKGSQATGVLYEGAVTKHPVMLAALSVLKVDFPDFYDSVQARPELLEEIRQVLFGRQDPLTLPLAAIESMQPYLQTDGGKLTSSVRREHGTLRQYLASIEGLRRPKSLQPLLCLAVDPISRNFGDGAQDIFEALVSGDTHGVLDALGRALDMEPLNEVQSGLLRDLVERAMEDTESRRTNTARVLARLSPRVVGSARRYLLTPLVRQIIALKEVRQEVGPSGASGIIADVTPTDQREVAGAFVDDLLHQGPVDWKKAGGGAPSIDELSELIQSAAALGITVWRHHGLESRHEEKLRAWLLDRTVESNEGSIHLPFSYLNALVSANYGTLLPGINPEYAGQAIEVLQSETETISDVSGTLDRLEAEFGRLAANGQEDRSVLWQLLTRLISVRNMDATTLAWRFSGIHKALANSDQASDFLAAFAARLVRDLLESETWEVEWPQGGSQFADLLNNWRENLTDTTADPLLKVVALWAQTENCEDLSIKCLDIFRDQSDTAWNKVIEEILSGEFGEIPNRTARYVGSALENMTDANATTLKGLLDTVVNSDAPNADHAAIYRTVLTAASPESWQTEPWSNHLQHAVARFAQMHSTPDFIERILPAIAGLVRCMQKGSAAGFISSLFANAAGQPEAYIGAHRAFHGHWPETNDDIGDYQPNEIATRGCQFIRENATNAGVDAVFSSLMEFYEKELITLDAYSTISKIIPTVWRTAPDALLAHDASAALMVTTNATVDLAIGAQPSGVDDAAFPLLLKTISDNHDGEFHVKTAQAILNAQPVPLADNPDGALAAWLSAMGNSAHVVATTLFAGEELNDEQLVRLATLLPQSFWISENMMLLGSVLTNASTPKMQAYILSNLSEISRIPKSGSARTPLTNCLIDSLPNLSAAHIQTVAKAINTLQGRSALERGKELLQSLDVDQLDALLQVFPASRNLKQIRHALDDATSSS